GMGPRTLSSNAITDNHAAADGGSIYTTKSLSIDGGSIETSSAARGGGLFNAAGTTDVESASFFDNVASVEGGAIYNAAGATLDVSAGMQVAEISGNGVTTETALNGGALSNHGTATITDMLLAS